MGTLIYGIKMFIEFYENMFFGERLLNLNNLVYALEMSTSFRPFLLIIPACLGIFIKKPIGFSLIAYYFYVIIFNIAYINLIALNQGEHIEPLFFVIMIAPLLFLYLINNAKSLKAKYSINNNLFIFNLIGIILAGIISSIIHWKQL